MSKVKEDIAYRVTPNLVYHFNSVSERDEFVKSVKDNRKKENNAGSLSKVSTDELLSLQEQYAEYSTHLIKAGDYGAYGQAQSILSGISKEILRRWTKK